MRPELEAESTPLSPHAVVVPSRDGLPGGERGRRLAGQSSPAARHCVLGRARGRGRRAWPRCGCKRRRRPFWVAGAARRRAEAADGTGRGGGDSGVRAAPRRLIYGKEVGEATEKLAVAVDLSWERRNGRGARRRRRRPPCRGRGEGEGGGSAGNFTKKFIGFPGIMNRSFGSLFCGLRV